MNRVTHFEIHAEDPERAIAFYEAVYNWQFEKWDNYDYWEIQTGDEDDYGIDGGLVKRQGKAFGKNVISFVSTIEVESVSDTLDLVELHGGKIASPKRVVPGEGWVAYFKDTEGNIAGLFEPDEDAAEERLRPDDDDDED
tara:strand:+ start:15750 stop:16169 length:420 start_codon:yes stop_codon:yes gene_type:complete